MNSETFRFQVGQFSCLSILDCKASYPPEVFFANMPKEQLQPQLRKYGNSDQAFECAYISLLVHAGERRVLIDTGMGTGGGFLPVMGKLVPHLRAEGIEPDTIDTVILSHGHPDHIGGNIDPSGAPVFPKAQFVMYKDEWEYWVSNPNLSELSLDPHFKEGILATARTNLLGIRAQLDLVQEPDTEILPGISAIATHGHTPGHMSLQISSGGESLLFVGDAFIHPIHIENPETLALVDHQPENLVKTRLRLLEKAAQEKCLVMGPHFPFPGLGHVVKGSAQWEWHPLREHRG
jgi:glyoxylase-like metal-dependent hydrolase (beta-lactamase superfamily II)